MARPLRIEFPDAWYHVMNRGAGYRSIFNEDPHRSMFLELLGELDRMFRVETHAYCLMDNHYHLLVHTPEGNLQRAMRHLNGVYTQRYNRLQKTDGALFRGRYQAILIEPDAYLLNVSRYIHLNPVVAGLAERASDYPWSSYNAYAGHAAAPEWLHSRFILAMIGQSRRRQRYRSFVEAGMDEETANFFGTSKRNPILGSDAFRERLVSNLEDNPEIPEMRRAVAIPTLSQIVTTVAERFSVSEETITRGARGRGKKNPGRTVAIYISRKIAGYSPNEIATHFGMTHYASASGIVSRCKRAIEIDKNVATAIDEIENNIKAKI
jgi:REP element-mobilizing transposase RayT